MHPLVWSSPGAGILSSTYLKQARRQRPKEGNRMHHRYSVLTLLLATLVGAGFVEVQPAAAQGTGTTSIEGVAFQETVQRDFLQEPGEPPIVGATVELW